MLDLDTNNYIDNSDKQGVLGFIIMSIPQFISQLPDNIKIISAILGVTLLFFSIRNKILDGKNKKIDEEIKKLELKNLKNRDIEENKILELLERLNKSNDIPKSEVEKILSDLKNNNSNLEELYKKRYGDK